MTVAPKSAVSTQRLAKAKIEPLSRSTPLWLRWLILLQRRSSVVTFLVVGATLWLYGATVYSQQLWSKEYYKLQTLRRQERQLATEGEVLKNQLAQQAEQENTGLIPPTPANNLFIEPAPERPAPSGANSPAKPAPSPKLSPTPLGY